MESVIGKRCIVRTYSAGVFSATVQSIDGVTAVLSDSRRLWRWSSGSELSELAMKGVHKKEVCRFSVAVPERVVKGVIEVIPMTDDAAATIDAVPEWSER